MNFVIRFHHTLCFTAKIAFMKRIYSNFIRIRLFGDNSFKIGLLVNFYSLAQLAIIKVPPTTPLLPIIMVL